MIGNFETALLLGSTKGNEDTFRHVETELTKLGYIVMAPVIYGYEKCKPWLEMLTDMCSAKCTICDICVIATPNYIGDATHGRIKQARELGKPVYVFDETLPSKLREYNEN